MKKILLAALLIPTLYQIQCTTNKVIRTHSGMKYIILKKAPSDTHAPQPGEFVSVHYTGWFNENGKPGKKFDSSLDRGKPFIFKVGYGQVIQGWDEALLSMHIGEKRRIILPAHLAYGHQGNASIPPYSSLIFDIELIDIIRA